MQIYCKFLFKLYINLVFILKFVINDCGLPGIPYNARLNRVERTFLDGETVEYQCEIKDLKLIGNSTRKCVNDKWNGTIPRCVEELNFGTINAIELGDTRNQTFENIKKTTWLNKDLTAAYYADYKQDQCMHSSKRSRPHKWKLYLTKVERHISYIEILFLNKNNKLSKTDATKVIKSAKVNDYRYCDKEIIESMDSTVRLGLTCFMEFDGDSIYEAWDKDQAHLIELEFDLDDVTICEIRLYKNSFIPFNRCGSADVVLFSKLEFVKSGTKHSGGSYYRYTCDKGFRLEGSETVRCGLNNNWLDEFPTCKPETTCSYPPSIHQSISVDINYEHLYASNGNISAIVGSVVVYNCVGEDHTNKSIMIGDSVRVCGSDGKWSGVDPICIHDYELNADYFNDIEESDKNVKQMTTFETFDNTLIVKNDTTESCGIPAMPLFAKPTSEKKFKLFGGQADIRMSYENGSKINYQCESAYQWVYGDVGERVCVNGKWEGNIGKCAINWGNKITLSTINVFDWKKGRWVNSHYVTETNSTNEHLDQHFTYRRDADKEGECARFSVENKHRWSLQLNQSVPITYFTVMLHPGGFFGNKHKIDDQKILDKSPVTAMLGQRQCVLTSAWDYTHAKVGTYFFFACDMNDKHFSTFDNIYQIDLDIDPNKFDKTYITKNVSICSLAIMVSKDDCGTPDLPLHSSVSYNSNTREWQYGCEPGYEMVGKSSVTCGKNGRWSGESPICQKKKLCPVREVNAQILTGIRINYKNLIKEDEDSVATLDSLANYSCITRKGDKKKVLIGSQVRVCTYLGIWSGSEPSCMNFEDLPQSKKSEKHSTSSVLTVLIVIISMGLVIGLVSYSFHKGFIRMPSITVPKLSVQRENSIETPKDINSNQSFDNPMHNNNNPMTPTETPKLPKQKSTKINENLVSFSMGTELLVEPDDDD